MEYKEYRFGVKVEWNGGSEVISLPDTNIAHVVISNDFVKNVMPVIYLSCNLSKSLLDKMIKGKLESTIILTIEKFASKSTNPGSGVDIDSGEIYFKKEFIYMLEDDINYQRDVESNPNDETLVEKDDLYAKTTIGLLYQKCINNNKNAVVNSIFNKSSKTDMILFATQHMSDGLLLEPLDNDSVIPSLVVPPSGNVAQLIKYIDSKSSLYKTPYRFYIDYERAYLVSSKGVNTQASDETVTTVIFNINNPLSKDSKLWGNKIDKKSYICELDAGMTKYYADSKSDNMFNNIIAIDSMGNKKETELDVQKIKGSNKRSVIIRTDNLDSIEAQKSRIETSQVLLQVIKNDIDSSYITLNKEYQVKNFEGNSEYDGKYILVQKTEIFSKEREQYKLHLSLLFKKIS